jgi:peptide/nickel transport system substrate-binding protein
MKLRHLMLASTIALALPALTTAAMAERVFNLSESPIGELDPAKGNDYADTVLAVNIYDTLVFPRADGPGVVPRLATEWTIDGTVYTFKLRDDVIFHSGNALTAADVVFSFERMAAINQGLSSMYVPRVASARAVDDHTVQFTLTEPYSPFLASLVRMPIVDSKLVLGHLADGAFGERGDYGQAYLTSHDAGSGAYSVVSQNPQTETVLKKFDAYFLPFAKNAPDTVRYRYGIEPSTMRALLARGEHDFSDPWLPPEVIAALAKEDGIQLFTESGATGEYIKFNTQRPPLDDVHCRRALSYAFDYANTLRIVQINDKYSQGIPMKGPIPSGLMGYDPAQPDIVQNLDLARQELAKCAYDPAQYPLDIAWIAEVPARERIALLMQASYGQLGFKVNVVKTPWALLTEQVTNPATGPHAVEIAVSANSPDTDSLLYNMYHSSNPPTWMAAEQLKDRTVDDLLDAARIETDPAAREALYRKLNVVLRDLAPGIFAYEFVAVFVGRDTIDIPDLANENTRSIEMFNLNFRNISVNEEK